MNDKMIQPETDSFFDEIANNFTNVSNDYRTIKISIKSSDWVSTITKLKDEHGLIFFSWLSAVDWTNEVVTGEPPKDKVEECFEILCCLSDIEYGNLVIVSTKIDKKNPTIDSLVDVYVGANWHERESYEMFGIIFEGHPDLKKLYLPDHFEGFPLLKSYELLSREVKPWPGEVDVEAMPDDESENKEQRKEE